jgi:parallel beta-helix repeat protein
MKMKGFLRKVLIVGIVALFLGAVGAAFFKVNMVAYAAGLIYIRADGSVEGTTFIQSSDNVTYVFTADINDSEGVFVERNNIIVNGNGHLLNNSLVMDRDGISLLSVSNVTIKNLSVYGFAWGIVLHDAANNTISGNYITNNGGGVGLESSSGNTASENNIINNGNEGVYLDGSSDNTIKENSIAYSGDKGIRMYSGSNNNTVSGNSITHCDHGIELDTSCSFNAIFKNNIADSNKNGINMAYSSSNNSIIENNITSNNNHGIDLYECSNNTISGNNIEANMYDGIIIQENSNNNTLTRNNVTANDGHGIDLVSSSGNILCGNNVTANGEDGVWLGGSSDNTFYHNNFANNAYQAESDGSPNTWDNGYPSGGNYWSDYLTRYPDATEIDHTGIGDTAYEINANNIDHYPLMIQYETTPPAIAILSPENKTYTVNASIPLTFTVDEFATWMGYSLDGQANVTITGNTTLPTLPDGWHYVTVYANDTFGNMGFATVYFTVDTTKPNITDVKQDPLTDISPGVVVKINATVTDTTSGIKRVVLNYTLADGPSTTVEMTNLEGDIWNATIPGFPYGANVTYLIVAEDNAGNTITTEQIYGYKYEYSVVPEFPLPTILFAFTLITLLLAVAFRRRKHLPHVTQQTPTFPFSAP